MATSSSTPITSLLLNNKNTHIHKNFNDVGQFSFPRKSNFHRFSSTRPSNKDLVVRRATPEAAGDLISSFSLTGIPLIGDNPWLAGAAGLLVGVPFIIQRLVGLTKQIDMAAQAVEKIAEGVEKVAEGVDKAAEDLKERLPDGRLKQVVSLVEHLAEETAEEAEKVVDLMDKKHDPDGVSIEIGVNLASEQLENFHNAMRVTRQRSFFGIPMGEKIWKPPKEGVFRVDVDACFDIEKSLFGVGIVIRDSLGDIRAAMAKPITNPGSILEAELIALLYGLGLCLQEELGPMVLFSDSILAVRSVSNMSKRGADNMECFGEFVELKYQGVILDVCHVYREANRVAHSLARFGALHSCMSCWSSHFPQWLRDVVKHDII